MNYLCLPLLSYSPEPWYDTDSQFTQRETKDYFEKQRTSWNLGRELLALKFHIHEPDDFSLSQSHYKSLTKTSRQEKALNIKTCILKQLSIFPQKEFENEDTPKYSNTNA